MDTGTSTVKVDWYCEAYRCWMLKSSCDDRRRRAVSGSYESRSKYASAGCGKCTQIKSGEKPMANISPKESEKIEEKKCKGPCGRTLPLDSFRFNKGTKDRREGKCIECRNGESRAAYVKRTAAAAADRAGKVRKRGRPVMKKGNLPAKTDLLPDVTPAPPFQLPDYLTRESNMAEVGGPVVNEDSKTILIDFSNYPEMFGALKDLAKNEFRSPNQQILYMLRNKIDPTVREFN